MKVPVLFNKLEKPKLVQIDELKSYMTSPNSLFSTKGSANWKPYVKLEIYRLSKVLRSKNRIFVTEEVLQTMTQVERLLYSVIE